MRQALRHRRRVVIGVIYVVLWALTAVVGTRQVEEEFIAGWTSDPAFADVKFDVVREDGTVRARGVADDWPSASAHAYSPLPFVVVLEHYEGKGMMSWMLMRTTSLWCGATRDIASSVLFVS